jgi:two-component system chemotaxis response regulator CheB
VVQDPKDAANPSMPQSALDAAGADYCVPLKEIAPLLVKLAFQGRTDDVPPKTGRI